MNDCDSTKDKPVIGEDTVSRTITNGGVSSASASTTTCVDQNNKSPETSSSSSAADSSKRSSKQTKRHLRLQSKLKTIKVRSLFDTDGDINSHNILKSEDGSSRPKRLPKKRTFSDDPVYSASDSNNNNNKKSSSSSHSQAPMTRRSAGRFPNPSKKQRYQVAVTAPATQPTLRGRRRRHEPAVVTTPAPSSPDSRKRRGRQSRNDSSSSMVSREQKEPAHSPGTTTAGGSGRVKKAAITPLQSAELLMQQRHKSVELLRPSPKSALDKARNQALRDRELELQSTLAHHDTLIRELAHMEVYQTIVDYRPGVYSTDERVTKFLLDYNLWDKANDSLLKKQRANLDRVIRSRPSQQTHTVPLIKMLQHSSELDALSTEPSLTTNDTQRQMLLRSLPPAAVNTIRTGTGIKKLNRQFPTLDAYLSSMVYLDDNDNDDPSTSIGTTKEAVNRYVEKERLIRERIRQLEEVGGGFTTRLKEQAYRRPQQLPSYLPQPPPAITASDLRYHHRQEAALNSSSIHDSVVTQAITAARNFHGHIKYRRNAAKKCAKAIDKYWDHIHSRDERLHRDEIKRLTRLAKWTAHQVRAKWRVVERICDARYKELVKEQQAKKSRRHLEMILEHSEQMLGVRMDELATHQQAGFPDTPRSSSSLVGSNDDDGWEDLKSSTATPSLKSWYNDKEHASSSSSPGTTTPGTLDTRSDESDSEHLVDGDEDAWDHVIDDLGGDDSDTSDGSQDEDASLTVDQLRLKYQRHEENGGNNVIDDDLDGSESSGSLDEDASQSYEEDERDHIIDEGDSDGSDSSGVLDEDASLTVDQLRQKYQHFGQDTEAEEDHSSPATMDEYDTGTDDESDEVFDLKALNSRVFEEMGVSQDSDYSTPSQSGTADGEDYDLNMSDDGETEDDDEVLVTLSTEADLPLDEVYARYRPLPTVDHEQGDDAGVDDSTHSNKDIPSQLETPMQQQSCTTPKTRKASVSLSDIDPDEVRLDKRVKCIDTTADDTPKLDDITVNDTNGEDDDDNTVTDYESEAPDEEDDHDNTLQPVKQQQAPSGPIPTKTELHDLPTDSRVERTDQAKQPTGATLSTTKVDTRIPFLLRGTLREYQHVGLDWLASLYNNGLNGILADEMGLGKTIQTIALLASLACNKGIWGPHLVVVPTSVILNWEMEFKRWLPGFKILTYYGNPKERKEKRFGWSKENAFHVCITSYQLVLQDQSAFRRKAWQYLILDEAHHIKNFRSQRWQVLLNFNSKRRLLLTGTPLQNNLMELWSLLYFLMPNGVSASMPIGFANLKEFQEWFSSPVDRMIENQQGMNEESRLAIQKLHTVLRPYLLRRLKVDVEQQMPAKYEHVIYCRLSKRQRYLYDDFMGRAKTKETLASGNFLSIINTLMQLRKVCNHPDLFEERPIVTSFSMASDVIDEGQHIDNLVRRLLHAGYDYDRWDARTSNLLIVRPELETTSHQWISDEYSSLDCSTAFMDTIQRQRRAMGGGVSARGLGSAKKYLELKTFAKAHAAQQQMAQIQRWESIHAINQQRCQQRPLLGAGLLDQCRLLYARPHQDLYFPTNDHPRCGAFQGRPDVISHCVLGYQDRIDRYMDVIVRYTFVTPAAVVRATPTLMAPSIPVKDILHPLTSRLQIAFPDKRLLQYDCGKLQRLALLLQQLAAGGHRVLIFTQMTRVLDVLEAFLNMHGHRYLRLDGSTKVEQRQLLTEQFNSDKRILCFILSTRSGGLGINLTGADTVIFYDSDWNPSMDKQCQDRAHRIGQLRDVHIYRFVTEYTIEENIFKKANQKRLLDDMVIQEGGFTNDYFQKMDWWKDLPEVTNAEQQQEQPTTIDMEQALLEAEGDEVDAQAAISARNEMTMDDDEFSDKPTVSSSKGISNLSKVSPSPSPSPSAPSPAIHPSLQSSPSPVPEHASKNQQKQQPLDLDVEDQDDNEDDKIQQLDAEVGHVDQYMLKFWEREMFGHYLGFGGFPEPED